MHGPAAGCGTECNENNNARTGRRAESRARQRLNALSSLRRTFPVVRVTGDTLSFHRDRLVQAPRPEHLRKLVDILAALDRSIGPDAIDLPGCRLHAFSGTMKGYFVSPVSAKWRVTSASKLYRPSMSITWITIDEGVATMSMHNPPHPGGIVRRHCLEPLGLSVTGAAEGLGLTRQALSEPGRREERHARRWRRR